MSNLTPQTRLFALRASLFRLAGVSIASTARINGRVNFQYYNASIGEGTWLGARCEVVSTPAARVTIGARCDISQDVYFICGSHEFGNRTRRAGRGTSDGVAIGDGTWVGARATFLAGSAVGSGCIVAAGSLVRSKFPDNVLIAGVPARIVRSLE